jgi:hypothetical protein
MATLEDHEVTHAAFRELKSGRETIDAASDYHDTSAAWHIA